MRSGSRAALCGAAPKPALLVMFASLLASLLAGCAISFTPHDAASPSPSTMAVAAATSTPAPFVCANPPGTSMFYAYVDKVGALYIVRGCAARRVAAPAGRELSPVAFSPMALRLLVWNNLANPQGPDTQSCLALVDVGTLAVTPTSFCSPANDASQTTQWLSFIGWASDASFYMSEMASDASVTVFFVSLPQQTRQVVTKLTWVAQVAATGEPSGIQLRGDALYYGGYASASEGGAFLHRFSLVSETDTRSVRLGLAGTGGCQGTDAPCTWTGPWDITQDGDRIAYHVPGPTQSMSDTSDEANTPLYVANSDGSGAQRLFPGQSLGNGFNQPSFSPDGGYVVTSFQAGDFSKPNTVVFERLSDGALTTAPAGLEWMSWTAQPGVALMENITEMGAPDFALHLELYNIATGTRTPLQTGSRGYVWAGIGS